jgi:hypothetical protein
LKKNLCGILILAGHISTLLKSVKNTDVVIIVKWENLLSLIYSCCMFNKIKHLSLFDGEIIMEDEILENITKLQLQLEEEEKKLFNLLAANNKMSENNANEDYASFSDSGYRTKRLETSILV